MGDQDTTQTPAAPAQAPAAPAAAGINWQERALTAEASVKQLQGDVEHWKGWSRKHEEASNGYRDNLTDVHRGRAIKAAAKAAGFRDPSDALDLASVRDVVKLNKDWGLAEGVESKLTEALTKVLESKPHWKAEQQPNGGAAGASGGIPGSLGQASQQQPYAPQFTQGTPQGEAVPSVADIVAAAMKRQF